MPSFLKDRFTRYRIHFIYIWGERERQCERDKGRKRINELEDDGKEGFVNLAALFHSRWCVNASTFFFYLNSFNSEKTSFVCFFPCYMLLSCFLQSFTLVKIIDFTVFSMWLCKQL